MEPPSASPPSQATAIPAWEGAVRALLQQVQTGDKRALEALYDQTHTAVFSLVLRMLRDEGAAEEVTLDVFLQIYRRAAEYDAARGGALGWILTIARSRAIDRLRSRGVRERHLDRSVPVDRLDGPPADEPLGGQERLLALSQSREVVQAALRRLTPEQRQVIDLAYFEGLTGSEIAEVLALPLGTVKSRLRLAIMNLRQHLGPVLEELAR